MLRCYARAVLFALLLLGASQVSAQTTPTFSPIATISATTTLVENRICYSDGRDIVCDTSAPTLGNVSQPDRIVSGSMALTVYPTGNMYYGNATSTSMVVNSNGGLDLYGQNPVLSLRGDSSSYYPAINFYALNSPVITGSIFGYASSLYVNAGTNMVLRTSGTEAVTITSNQKVGIGTTTPQQTLDVSGSAMLRGETWIRPEVGNGQLHLLGGPGSAYSILDFASNGSYTPHASLVYYDTLKTMNIYGDGGVTLRPGTSNTAALYAGSNGNVGVGTETPQAVLHVSGTELVISNSEVRGGVSTTFVRLATSAGTSTPPAVQCAGPSDYGRVMYGGDNRPYICNPRP